MAVTTAAYFLFALLLVVAGGAKARDPSPTRQAFAAANRPLSEGAVRTLGATEVAGGAVALIVGGTFGGAALALSYASLAGVAEHQRRRGAPCGCFGASPTLVTPLHVGVNAIGATVGVLAALAPAPPLGEILTAQPLAGLPLLVALGTGVGLLRLLLVSAPEVLRKVSSEVSR